MMVTVKAAEKDSLAKKQAEHQDSLRKKKAEYQTPKLREYGSVAKLTLKPGTRTDGQSGNPGDKGSG